HRWAFRTGNAGDFEYLVRLLQPQPMDARVGRRDLDVQAPGSDLRGITGPDADGGLRLGGALKVPDEDLTDEQRDEAARFEAWDPAAPPPYQEGPGRFHHRARRLRSAARALAHPAPAAARPQGQPGRRRPRPRSAHPPAALRALARAGPAPAGRRRRAPAPP